MANSTCWIWILKLWTIEVQDSWSKFCKIRANFNQDQNKGIAHSDGYGWCIMDITWVTDPLIPCDDWQWACGDHLQRCHWLKLMSWPKQIADAKIANAILRLLARFQPLLTSAFARAPKQDAMIPKCAYTYRCPTCLLLLVNLPCTGAKASAAAPAPGASSGGRLSTSTEHLTLRLFSINPNQIILHFGMRPFSSISAHGSVFSLALFTELPSLVHIVLIERSLYTKYWNCC